MLTLEEALSLILAQIPATQGTRADLEQSNGRFLTTSICSTIDLPPFDNSGMDGYAVRSEDVLTASQENPVLLKLLGRVPAGTVFEGEVQRGQCVRVFTGSPLPRGTNAVVMQEDTRIEHPGEVSILEPAKPFDYVRLQGEDVRAGTQIAKAGSRISPATIGLMGACGIGSVEVGPLPRMALLATGSELLEPGEHLTPGKIHESNRLMLASLSSEVGVSTNIYPLVKDDLLATKEALETAFSNSDFVVTSGGVSVGEMDYVKAGFEKMGGKLQFWKIAMRPGKPFVFGTWKDKFLFGLPGNPVSTFVTFLLLVRPALLKFQGAVETGLSTQHGILNESVSNAGPRRHFIRVFIDPSGIIMPSGTQTSHMLSSLAKANGLLDMPPEIKLKQGQRVTVLRF